MIETEITQAKQCALTTRDWDTFQVIVRTCLSPRKSPPGHFADQKQAGSGASSVDTMLSTQKRE